ncbi:hypothetical protein QE152_g4311 [Popillia japonica]|uniref:Uncharacterized protein n=1 Tax=Popillia japonica TaxID=7064 RepID=A0AAW1N1S1_POPJA
MNRNLLTNATQSLCSKAEEWFSANMLKFVMNRNLLTNATQSLCSKAEEWFSANMLKLNPVKTQTLTFSAVCGDGLGVATLLGVTLDDRLSWCPRINRQCGLF